MTDVPSGVNVQEVDYDSDTSLQKALHGQDALVSTVAMSAVSNQPRLIDAAITAGVKHFIPAEYSISTRDPKAQWLPVYSTVIEIQKYLESRDRTQSTMGWTVVNCGAMIEFALDYPFVIDFDNHVATFYDGGNNKLSLSTATIVGRAIAGLLKQPDRVKNHCVQVHGTTLTQRQALKIAENYSQKLWTVEEKDAEATIETAMNKIRAGGSGAELTTAMIAVISAATFGNGHFAGAYTNPDNDWLGIEPMEEKEVDEAIRRRMAEGPGFAFSASSANIEGMGDVANGLLAKYNDRA